jgi:EmrB/QacA subfamily drug resistance transporter
MAQKDPNISRIRDEAAPRPADAGATPDAVAGPLADPRRWIALAIVLTAGFVVLVDATIVNVAIPSIRNSLGASFAQIQWVVAGYALAYAVALITGGRLGDQYGRKRLFMLGMAGFTLASLSCGLAPNPTLLVGSRVLQGLMAALMFPQVLSVIQVTFPARERGTALGLFGAIVGIATVLGPLVGGLIIGDNTTGSAWRFIFLVNLPIGVVSLAAAAWLMRESRAPQAGRLDLVGVGILSVALVLITYPLVEGRDADWAPWTYVSIAAGVVVLAIFLMVERMVDRRGNTPLVQLRMFRDRAFSVGSLTGFVFFAGIPTYAFTFNLMLQAGLRFSALHAGLTTIPFSLGLMTGSGMSIRLAPRLGKGILLIGSAVFALGMLGIIGTLQAAGPDITSLQLAPALLVSGLGMGYVIAPLVNIVLAGIRQGDVGSASGVVTTMQQLGGAVGVAVIGVIFFGLLGTRVDSATADLAPQLRASLARVETTAPQSQIDAQVQLFEHCFPMRVRAKDPSAAIPGCPAPGTGGPAALSQVTGAAAAQGLAVSFTDTEKVTLLFNVGAFAGTFLLVLLVPRVRPPVTHEPEGVAA